MSSSTSAAAGRRRLAGSRLGQLRGAILFPAALLIVVSSVPGSAQDGVPQPVRSDEIEAANDGDVARRDPHDPAVPAGAVRAFIDACRAGNYEAAASRLDLGDLPQDQRAVRGARLARQFKTVLDQKLWIQFERLSQRPEGDLDDGLPAELDRLGTISDGFDVDVLLARGPGEGGRLVWKFARSTVAAIPALYDEFGYGAIGEMLPPAMFELSFLEIRLVQWVGLLLLIVVAWVVAWILVSGIQRAVRPVVVRTRSDLDDRLLQLLAAPSRFLLTLAIFAAGAYLLRFAAPVYGFLTHLEHGLALVGITWAILRLVDVGSDILGARFDRIGNVAARTVVPLGRRTLKAVLLIVAVVGMLQNLGFNVTGLIAGLGVGGLAFALAAQKTIANLFGGVTLVTDQPVRVGDFCRFGDGKLGTVEQIGLRSTSIRTLERTRVTIPNSVFAELQLENFAPRDRRRLATVLGLRYETNADQLRYVLAALREVLVGHPRVADEPLRVRFAGFGACSLDVELLAFVETRDHDEFCAIREDLYLRMMDVVNRAGTGFAFPSQTLYLGRDGGLDPERGKRAQEAVRTWRREGRLPFPDFSPEAAEALRNRLDYPPEGSATASARDASPQDG